MLHVEMYRPILISTRSATCLNDDISVCYFYVLCSNISMCFCLLTILYCLLYICMRCLFFFFCLAMTNKLYIFNICNVLFGLESLKVKVIMKSLL